ncbi:hypothetical protein LOD99_7685 [Oopsacas minuta]|uniref:Uncharacterized protein n=1 Tax=Oopsacas minuta TaxID=111878 RepID=A0AAV7JQE1_9METZ|nr:hypothetical protein LOD99_7685 [Oopsacas minuta]
MSKRDPFPFPRRQNDNDFMLKNSQNQNIAQINSPKLKETQFDHLYNSKTVSSQNREWSRAISHTPHDKLDAALGADYDHHLHFNKDSAEAFKHKDTAQQRTLSLSLNNTAMKTNDDGKGFSHPEKESIDHVRGLAIVGPHIYATNRGYSRKPDGGFFAS